MNVNSHDIENKKRLHDLGDKIERIADRLKKKGVAESAELYQLGDEVEHFFDSEDTPETGSVIREDLVSQAQKDSSSTVNRSQSAG